jgi:hypothetical protein
LYFPKTNQKSLRRLLARTDLYPYPKPPPSTTGVHALAPEDLVFPRRGFVDDFFFLGISDLLRVFSGWALAVSMVQGADGGGGHRTKEGEKEKEKRV